MDNEAIKQLDIWGHLTKVEQEKLLHEAKVRLVARSNVVFHETEKGNRVYVLISGKVLLKHCNNSPEDLVIHLVCPGELFGESLLTSASTYGYRAETLEDSAIAFIPLVAFMEIFQKNAQVGWYFFHSQARRLQKAEGKLIDFRYQRTEKRILALLKELKEEQGRRLVSGEWEITGRLTHQLIASLALTTRQSVSVILNKLKKKGIINYNRHHIIIRRPDLL
jgi:CRP/FNR family transcriptional regulator, nitrogen oxide reductase regulator